MLGRMLGRYRIDSMLGRGGMGVVYRAHDTSLNRDVAIKVLPPEAVSDPSRKQRFVVEAKAASALNHPAIVTIYDISADAGVDFMVMELVSGETLDRVIKAGLSNSRALRYATAIADAMAMAHAAGIVHRDLKPTNVMVTEDGRIKVLDFGLAKLIEPPAASDDAETRALTDAGAVLGTAAYMSPEQVRGENVDARSDIFSFGVLLYEMVTGRRPFDADSRVSTMARILDQDPPAPSTVAPISADVERTVLKCLRKDPARRYQTMADLKVAIDDLLADASDSSATAATAAPRAGSGRAWLWSAAAIVVLAGVSFAAWRLGSRQPQLAPLQARPLASLPGITRSPSFSPDGNQIAFSWSGPDGSNTDVYVQQIGAGAPLRITSNPASDYSPQWSPDGRWIAFLRGDGDGGRHELRLVPPLSGSERRVTEIRPRGLRRPVTIAWCPDSRCIAVTDSGGDHKPDALFLVSLDSGEKRQVSYPPDSVFADADPAISPDGRWLAFRRDIAPFSGELHLQPFGTDTEKPRESRRLVPLTTYPYDPRWFPDSSAIVFGAKAALWTITLAPGATPERLPFVGGDGTMPVLSNVRADGTSRLAYVRSYNDYNIWKIETPAAGKPAVTAASVAISSTRLDFVPHVSSDGRHLLFNSTRSGENEIWRAETSGAGAVQLTHMGLNPGWARWSPDGALVTFMTTGINNTGDVFVVAADGAGTPRNLTAHPANDAIASFSRDGKWIYFQSARDGTPAIWKMPAGGGPAVRVTPGSAMMAIESPDGRFIYYSDSPGPNAAASLWRMPVAGDEATRLATGLLPTSFDVADAGVYFIERLPGDARLRYVDASTREVVTVAPSLGDVALGGLGVSPDGRTIYFTRVDTSVNDLMLVEGVR